MKNIIYLLVASLLAPPPAAFASTEGAITSANCGSKTEEMIPKEVSPSEDKDASHCEGSASDMDQCPKTVKKIRETAEWLKSQMTSLCQKASSSGQANTGTAAESQAGVAKLTDEAAKFAGTIRDRLQAEVQNLEKAKEIHARAVTKEFEAFERERRAQAQAAKARTNQISSKSDISRSEFPGVRRQVDGIVGHKALQAALRNKVATTHAITVWKAGIEELNSTANALRNVSNTTENNAKKTESESGLGLGIKDMIPLLAAAAPLAALMMNKQNQASNSSGLSDSSLANQATTPTDTTQKSPEANRDIASTPTAQNTPTNAEFTAASTSPNGAEFGQVSTPVSPSTSPADTDSASSMLGKFDGALGSSPFSGSSTSIPGGSSSGGSLDSAGGSTGASSSKDGIADILKAAEHGDYAAGAGGGAAAFGGGSLGSDPTKDLLKGGDPFADTAALGTDETFPAADGMGLEGAHGELGSAVPGADDSRSLFSRVRDYHRRCLKRGCVTGEQGGKI